MSNATPNPDSEYRWTDTDSWTFEATADPYGLARALEPVAAVTNEAVVRIDPHGVRARAMDPARVAAVDVSCDCIRAADGAVAVGCNVADLTDAWPGYYEGQDYQVTIDHAPSLKELTVSNGAEGSTTTDAFDPETVRSTPDSWPSPEGGYAHEVTLAAPTARGLLGGMAAAAQAGGHGNRDALRLCPQDDHLRVETLVDDGTIRQSWGVDATGLTRGPYQYYAADYLTDMVPELWADGEVTIRFGRDQTLELQNDGLRLALAPRLIDQVESWEGDR